MNWQIKEAKNKLNEVIDKTLQEGPQIITKKGKEVVVMLSISDYKKSQMPQKPLGSFFHESPLTYDLFNDRSQDDTLRSDLTVSYSSFPASL